MAGLDDLPDWERIQAVQEHLHAAQEHLQAAAQQIQALALGEPPRSEPPRRPRERRMSALEQSRALWNRSHLDLRSDEILAQILDRGELAAWRELYALASRDPELRGRIAAIVRRVPIAYPYFWVAALQSLGEVVDWNAPMPEDVGI